MTRAGAPEAPFIDVNCASLPESLAEAELFGHEKGAFTGADRPRKGHFEQAHGGTLFLDEVGELSLQLQPQLLRVLELREVRRIGGAYSVAVDFRLIMATHRNLEDMIRAGNFREDLYHRMNVCSIRTPALRERTDDILVLAHHFAGQYAREMNRAVRCFSGDVLNLFLGYPWPGNVRELQNVLRQTVLTCKKNTVDVADLPFEFFTENRGGPCEVGNLSSDHEGCFPPPLCICHYGRARKLAPGSASAGDSPQHISPDREIRRIKGPARQPARIIACPLGQIQRGSS